MLIKRYVDADTGFAHDRRDFGVRRQASARRCHEKPTLALVERPRLTYLKLAVYSQGVVL
jgi:hypothetical protein